MANRRTLIILCICHALKRFPGQHRALIIYDICCQWIIHFRERVSQLEFLQLADSMDITGAVGKWHLAAHILECFPKFSLNFVEGARQVAINQRGDRLNIYNVISDNGKRILYFYFDVYITNVIQYIHFRKSVGNCRKPRSAGGTYRALCPP